VLPVGNLRLLHDGLSQVHGVQPLVFRQQEALLGWNL